MRAGRFLTAGTAMMGALVMTGGALAGCSSSIDSSDGSSGTTRTVKVEMTADGCKVTPDTIAAGPVTFEITNTNAAAVTEVELISDNRILAERENIAPGLAPVSFSHKLDGGSYELYCPGATNEKTKFTVTGKAAQATGTVADLLFLRLMLRHHQGGMHMMQYGAEHASFGPERALAASMVTTQNGEMTLLGQMITARGGQPLAMN